MCPRLDQQFIDASDRKRPGVAHVGGICAPPWLVEATPQTWDTRGNCRREGIQQGGLRESGTVEAARIVNLLGVTVVADGTEEALQQHQLPLGLGLRLRERRRAPICPARHLARPPFCPPIVVVAIQVHPVRSSIEAAVRVVVPLILPPPRTAQLVVHNILVPLRVENGATQISIPSTMAVTAGSLP